MIARTGNNEVEPEKKIEDVPKTLDNSPKVKFGSLRRLPKYTKIRTKHIRDLVTTDNQTKNQLSTLEIKKDVIEDMSVDKRNRLMSFVRRNKWMAFPLALGAGALIPSAVEAARQPNESGQSFVSNAGAAFGTGLDKAKEAGKLFMGMDTSSKMITGSFGVGLTAATILGLWAYGRKKRQGTKAEREDRKRRRHLLEDKIEKLQTGDETVQRKST